MRYQLQVTAYDVMDQVQVSLVVRELLAAECTAPARTLSRQTTVRGTGESDPALWAIDALVAALETL